MIVELLEQKSMVFGHATFQRQLQREEVRIKSKITQGLRNVPRGNNRRSSTVRTAESSERRLQEELLFYGFIGGDFAVADMDDAVSVLRYVVFVGDENDGVAFAVQVGKKRHDLLAGPRIEVAGRLVG
jgi:hypothetical protein